MEGKAVAMATAGKLSDLTENKLFHVGVNETEWEDRETENTGTDTDRQRTNEKWEKTGNIRREKRQ
jgi:hypothetical protein